MKRLKAEETLDNAAELRAKAREFARMAEEARDPVVVVELRNLAREYERYAETLERRQDSRSPGRAWAGSAAND